MQYCNMTWSYFITYFKWFYTENKHNLLDLKYTYKESAIQTTDQYNISCTSTWNEECMHGVHVFWDHFCISMMFWYVLLLVCMFVSALARYIFLSEGRSQTLLHYHWKIWHLNHFVFVLMAMADDSRSLYEYMITVVEESGRRAGGLYCIPKSMERAWPLKYRMDG